MNIDEIVKKISSLKIKDKTLLIAIDGFGGSGKTTLAQKLKNNFENATIVQIDDFYSHQLKRADRERILHEVIKPLQENILARYQVYDWEKKKLTQWVEMKPGGLVIIEGVSAMHPDFGKYDVTIWVDCSQEEAAQRGIARDINEHKVDTTQQWRNDWMPQEKEYVEEHKPKDKADFIVDGTIEK